MRTKIEIKSIFGKLLFEFEKEVNTIKDTVCMAVKTDADLTGADLTGANLRGAYLRDAYLRGAYLTGAYLTDADLRGADLTGANLTGADLRGADLTGADLRGADLRGANLRGAYLTDADLNNIKIKKAAVFTGLYDYVVIPFIAEDGTKYVKMGCFTRALKDWDENFWNNDNEFPNNGSEKSNMRKFAYETAKKWFDLIQSKEEPK